MHLEIQYIFKDIKYVTRNQEKNITKIFNYTKNKNMTKKNNCCYEYKNIHVKIRTMMTDLYLVLDKNSDLLL